MSLGPLGGDFSTEFANVLLAMNGVTIAILLIGTFFDAIASACVKALRHVLSTLVFLKAHFGMPPKR